MPEMPGNNVGRGRKNSSYQSENFINMIGHVWDLWGESNVLEIVDPALGNTHEYDTEILRCIHIAVLCVQESAAARPSMSEVVFMSCNEMSLQPPGQAAFLLRTANRGVTNTSSVGCWQLLILLLNGMIFILKIRALLFAALPQELLVCGEFQHLMRQEDGRIGLLSRIWIWLSAQPSKDGNTFLFENIQVKSELPSTFKVFRYQQHRWSCGPANLLKKWPSGKATGFGPGIRRFESFRPRSKLQQTRVNGLELTRLRSQRNSWLKHCN
ncbi:uncharacterized protein LOC108222978 isoform X2 [Daucus carota subsp. sativus]|uniref:uncharacterized protein LOC108222978 isoform X2 n=1 Tax=Daucus carota subsp. sativus TaxID=79200 RepID=UPI003082BEE4